MSVVRFTFNEREKMNTPNNALELAEGFISTFEDDPSQEGVAYLLENIRAAISEPPPLIVLEIDGGVLQNVWADDARVVLIDRDEEEENPEWALVTKIYPTATLDAMSEDTRAEVDAVLAPRQTPTPALLNTCRELLACLIETHADEVAANHNGDDSGCSYCAAIAIATSELRALEGGAA